MSLLRMEPNLVRQVAMLSGDPKFQSLLGWLKESRVALLESFEKSDEKELTILIGSARMMSELIGVLEKAPESAEKLGRT